MTTIAYRNGLLAADTAMCVAGSMVGRTTKIARRNDGWMAGAAGNATYLTAFLDWFLSGQNGDPPEAKESERHIDRGVIFWPDGEIHVFEPGGTFTLRAEYYAFGSGMDYAIGAMFTGAGAEQAVRAACAHDPHSGGEVTVLCR